MENVTDIFIFLAIASAVTVVTVTLAAGIEAVRQVIWTRRNRMQ